MLESLAEKRSQYFAKIVGTHRQGERQRQRLVVITHLLSDRPEFLAALASLCKVSLIVAIPYSTHLETLHLLRSTYDVLTPTTAQLSDPTWLGGVAQQATGSAPFLALEIGGYFAEALRVGGAKITGVVEDTEAGHRRYEQVQPLPCPVFSVARSTLKEPEDVMVGASCLFSTETILRNAGAPLEARSALVIGYGRVGRGLARALQSRNCRVMVRDSSPVKEALAVADGCAIVGFADALSEADIVFGATGSCSVGDAEYSKLKRGAILVSCSSRTVEFNLPALLSRFPERRMLISGLEQYSNASQCVYLLAGGTPVNFRDGAVIGPLLSLVQGEILHAVGLLLDSHEPGLHEVSASDRATIARQWIETFIDPRTGFYQQR